MIERACAGRAPRLLPARLILVLVLTPVLALGLLPGCSGGQPPPQTPGGVAPSVTPGEVPVPDIGPEGWALVPESELPAPVRDWLVAFRQVGRPFAFAQPAGGISYVVLGQLEPVTVSEVAELPGGYTQVRLESDPTGALHIGIAVAGTGPVLVYDATGELVPSLRDAHFLGVAPLPAESRLVLLQPSPGQTVGLPLRVRGYASAYQGSLGFRVRDGAGRILVERWAVTAAGEPMWGSFETSLVFEPPPGGAVTLEVLDADLGPVPYTEYRLAEVPLTVSATAGCLPDLTDPPATAGQDPAFSPHGRLVAVAVNPPAGNATRPSELRLWDLDSGTVHVLWSGPGPVAHPAWDDTGRYLAFLVGGVEDPSGWREAKVLVHDALDWGPAGTTGLVARYSRYESIEGYLDWASWPAHRLLVSRPPGVWTDPVSQALTDPLDQVQLPALSPSGRQVAWMEYIEGAQELRVCDLDPWLDEASSLGPGTTRTYEVASFPCYGLMNGMMPPPAWLDEDRLVVVVQRPEGHFALYLVERSAGAIAGWAADPVVTELLPLGTRPLAAPGGRSLAFLTRDPITGADSAGVYSLDTGQVTRFPGAAGPAMLWSPDGGRLLVWGGTRAVVCEVATGVAITLLEGGGGRLGWAASWSPDGRVVALAVETADGGWEVRLLGVETRGDR